MKRKHKFLIAGLCGVVAAGAVAGGVLLFGAKEATTPVVSPGVCRLADRATVCCSAPAGQAVGITAETLDTALAGGAVTAVTVTALPPATEGQLLLGHTPVAAGQTIPRETLSYLTFVPAEGVVNSSFSFVPTTADGPAGYALTCRLKVTEGVNCCPVGRGSVMAISTHASLALSGTLVAADPEGDPLVYEICRYPEHGTLSLDAATGAFVYTPSADYYGPDAFTWRAQDDAGAYAPDVSVSINVRALSTGWLYEDIPDGALHSDALTVSERGWLTGDEVGGRHYFRPDEPLSRAAFAAVLLQAAGVNAPDVEHTGYADDADIPAGMRGAAEYIRTRGLAGENFRPDDTVTRSEAAVWAAAVLKLAAPTYAEAVRDFDSLPVATVDALYAAYEAGLLPAFADGTLSPDALMTRGDGAIFFARLADKKA